MSAGVSDALFERAQRVADAVLFEGYVLYPYRASAAKNLYRWQFGVVAPRAPREDGEPWFSQTECIVSRPAEPVTAAPSLHVRVRFLRPQAADMAAGDDRRWLQGVAQAIDVAAADIDTNPAPTTVPLMASGLAAQLTIDAEPLGLFIKVRLRIENLEPWRELFDTDRDAMLERSLVGTHLLLAVENARFESLVEPTPSAAALVGHCVNVHTWPVLVGDRGQRTVMLSSPIVLYDFPGIATESRGDLCDGAEIDEILSLRILTLTDAEKAEARRTDPKAREIVDRVDAMTEAEFGSLHGAMRSADFVNPPDTPAPTDASITIAGQEVARGSHVRLRPNRRADAMDMFLRDQPATVTGIYRDVDDRVYVAVTVDADPAASLHESFGRYFYFDPAEIEPMRQQENGS